MAAKYPGPGEQPPSLNKIQDVTAAALAAREDLLDAVGQLVAIQLWMSAHIAAMDNMQIPAGADMGRALANVEEVLATARPLYIRIDSLYMRIEALTK